MISKPKTTVTSTKQTPNAQYLHSLHAHDIVSHCVASFLSEVRLKVHLDEGRRVAEVFVSSATKCRDIVQRLQRQIHATDCFLLEVWQGCGE